MTVLMRLVSVSLAAVAAVAAVHTTAYGQTPVRDRAAPSAGAAVIRGRAVALETGKPLRVAFVTLSGAASFRTQYTLTDDDGRYEFINLPAGRYTVSASSYSFISLSYGQTRPFQSGRPFVVAEKQVVEHVDLALPRGGVITGIVTDEFGDPEVQARVTVMKTTYQGGQQSLVSTGEPGLTDDRGQFRALGLQPGSYYVSVSKRVVSSPGAAMVPTYPTLYAPGTPSPAQAQRVQVELGRTVDNVDIVLAPTPMATIAGTVVDADGQPLRGAMLVLSAAGVLDPAPRTTDTGLNPGTNSFIFTAVPPGTYDLRAAVPRLSLRAAATVSVSGEDLTDVRLSPIQLAKLMGRVVDEAGAPAALPLSSITMGTLSANPTDPPSWNAGTAALERDLTFTVPVLPGRWLLNPSLPSGWGLKSVRLRGVDVMDTGIVFQEGDEVRDLEVVLTNRPLLVSGTVRDSNGEAVNDYTVLLFAKDRERRRIVNRYFAQARPDQQGQFLVSHLAPGEYYAVALEYVSVDEMHDPDLLDQLARDARTFTLREGETTKLELPLAR